MHEYMLYEFVFFTRADCHDFGGFPPFDLSKEKKEEEA